MNLAAKVGARSADHLIYIDEAGADALAGANVCATLLPIAAFYLKLGRFAPARMLIDRGVPVALASDVNPGGGLSPSMPFAITLACFGMHMTLEEAVVAATLTVRPKGFSNTTSKWDEFLQSSVNGLRLGLGLRRNRQEQQKQKERAEQDHRASPAAQPLDQAHWKL